MNCIHSSHYSYSFLSHQPDLRPNITIARVPQLGNSDAHFLPSEVCLFLHPGTQDFPDILNAKMDSDL